MNGIGAEPAQRSIPYIFWFAYIILFAKFAKANIAITMSHVCLLTHIVISTYNREMCIGTEQSTDLYRYLTGIIKNQGCKLIVINGIPNHIHILIDLSPKIALSALVMELKRSSSIWMKESGKFPMFKKWADGYFASSLSFSHKQNVIDYIMRQQEHHLAMRFEDEYNRLILKNGLTLYKFPEI